MNVEKTELADQTRVFSLEDQLAFARVSGDYNPLHIEPVVARRTLFGRPVVHGIHMVLWALSQCLPGPARLTKLSASFNVPLGVDEPLKVRIVRNDPTGLHIQLESGGAKLGTIKLAYEARSGEAVRPASGFPPRLACCDLDEASIPTAHGELQTMLDAEAVEALLPGLQQRLEAVQIADLLATTRIVGMLCPGLHSVFVALRLQFKKQEVAAGSQNMMWRVSGFEGEFNRTLIEVDSAQANGTLETFLRPMPRGQASVEALRQLIAGDAFSHQKALVIGGSRGLGELTAKILAAGGAEVRLTYNQGRQDAERVVQEIVRHGGKSEAAIFNILDPHASFDGLVSKAWFPTHVYYFPTPAIFVGHKGGFSDELLQKFEAFYVRGVETVHNGLRAVSTEALTFFYPSSVAVDSNPDGMAEYAAAKAKGEALCETLALRDRSFKLHIERLPRLATDQTATLMRAEAEDNVAVLSAILRQLA